MTTDPDIFYVLLVPGEPSIHYYAENWCSIGSCVFKLLHYFYECGISDIGPDGNVTAHLLSKKFFERPEGKSGHKLSAALDVGIHKALILAEGYSTNWVPASAAYWAHISLGFARMLPGGKC